VTGCGVCFASGRATARAFAIEGVVWGREGIWRGGSGGFALEDDAVGWIDGSMSPISAAKGVTFGTKDRTAWTGFGATSPAVIGGRGGLATADRVVAEELVVGKWIVEPCEEDDVELLGPSRFCFFARGFFLLLLALSEAEWLVEEVVPGDDEDSVVPLGRLGLFRVAERGSSSAVVDAMDAAKV